MPEAIHSAPSPNRAYVTALETLTGIRFRFVDRLAFHRHEADAECIDYIGSDQRQGLIGQRVDAFVRELDRHLQLSAYTGDVRRARSGCLHCAATE